MKKLLIFFLSLLLLSGSCDFRMAIPVEDTLLIEEDPFLVVYSFISPQDSLIKVQVTESRPKSGDYTFTPLSDVLVMISNGADTLRLTYRADSTSRLATYQISAQSFPVEGGNEYFLSVLTPDGREATSRCRVPKNTPDFQVEFIKYTSGEYYSTWRDTYGALINWQDFENETNYYRFIHEKSEVREGEAMPGMLWERPSYHQPPFYDDASKQGTTFKLESPAYMIPNVEDENYEVPEASILDFYVLNCDSLYYEHHKRLYGTGNVDGSLFDRFREPSHIPSNINGGFGVFAAYNGSKQRFVIKNAGTL